MKRIISLLLVLSIFAGAVFAQEDDGPDIYEDDFEYLQNGPGDQFLKIELGAIFPLNFGDKLWPGVQATIGYYRFLNQWLALGGEISVSSEFSIGNKALFMVPITFGVMFQPTVKKFEFPIFLTMGIADHTWANATYFPAFTIKAEAGAFYRFTEAWSFGLTTFVMWSVEKARGDYTHGWFETASLAARYHF
ncbi:hypothetical protein MSI_03990 [Treponema sp. JC4]|uniref:TP0733 family outer membrane beta-barrel protein n=1 Tax=Treponema sp. JC4 TaxID=1124982 RepID=UPI00025B0D72|nr:hypothetical protein [Treponema sp. JC4]EID85968.1 hypothetical protein MSI_03990 [Treponema sp. JC4]